MQEEGRDLPERAAGCGGSSRASFARWDRDSSSWRTSQRCFDGEWETYSGRFPTSGTMRNGIACPRDPWERPTVATASSSWPTPTATDATMRGERAGIPESVLSSPTPVSGHNVSLQHAERIWATPTANVAKNITPGINYAVRLAKGHLDGQVAQVEGEGGNLNPTWVEWLMGFPLGHTALEPSETP